MRGSHQSPDASGGKIAIDAETLAAKLESQRQGAPSVRSADVSDPDAVKEMMDGVRQNWGEIDILINNAGILRDRSIAKMTLDQWRSVLDVNLSGVFYCCKFGLESSVTAVRSCASAAGREDGLSWSIKLRRRQSWCPRPRTCACPREAAAVRVNAVAPGVIDTPMVAQVAENARDQLKSSIALRPWVGLTKWLPLCSFFARRWPGTSPAMSWRSMADISANFCSVGGV